MYIGLQNYVNITTYTTLNTSTLLRIQRDMCLHCTTFTPKYMLKNYD